MVFSSLNFLFVFLPLFLISYYLVDTKLKNICVLFYSLGFYAYGCIDNPHYVLILGADLAAAAFSIGFLLETGYRQSCRNELKMYGLKSVAIGVIFAAAHVFFFVINPKYDNFLIFAEFFMFTVLIMYALIAHITQEYLFARMLDVSSEKIQKECRQKTDQARLWRARRSFSSTSSGVFFGRDCTAVWAWTIE